MVVPIPINTVQHVVFTKNKNFSVNGWESLTPPLVETNLYHYLHKKNKPLVPTLSDSLQEMQRDGEINREREWFIKALFQTNATAD